MNLLADQLRENQAEPASLNAVLVTTVSAESWAHSVIEALPNLQVTLVDQAADVSQESEQVDSHNTAKSLADLTAELKKLLGANKNTGHVHVYLLDSVGLAAGDIKSQAALRAFAQRAVASSDRTLAALTPENFGMEQYADLDPHTVAGHRAALLAYTDAIGVRVATTTEQLLEMLQQA